MYIAYAVEQNASLLIRSESIPQVADRNLINIRTFGVLRVAALVEGGNDLALAFALAMHGGVIRHVALALAFALAIHEGVILENFANKRPAYFGGEAVTGAAGDTYFRQIYHS